MKIKYDIFYTMKESLESLIYYRKKYNIDISPSSKAEIIGILLHVFEIYDKDERFEYSDIIGFCKRTYSDNIVVLCIPAKITDINDVMDTIIKQDIYTIESFLINHFS